MADMTSIKAPLLPSLGKYKFIDPAEQMHTLPAPGGGTNSCLFK